MFCVLMDVPLVIDTMFFEIHFRNLDLQETLFLNNCPIERDSRVESILASYRAG